MAVFDLGGGILNHAAMNDAEHWESVYANKGDTELSWFQAQPGLSLELLREVQPAPRGVVDIGGGQSALASALLDAGVGRVVVLDLSHSAIERGKARLGDRAASVEWVVGDVLDQRDYGEIDAWHDRAVFHFLVDHTARRRYTDAAAKAVPVGGHAVVATFALTGPEKCSGLPVRRYEPDSLAGEFAARFRLIKTANETHTTPWGQTQDFVYVVLRREAD